MNAEDNDTKLLIIKRFNQLLRKCWRFPKKLSSDDLQLTETSSNYNLPYKKRDNTNLSLNLQRNEQNNYEIVLPYEKYIKRKYKCG